MNSKTIGINIGPNDPKKGKMKATNDLKNFLHVLLDSDTEFKTLGALSWWHQAGPVHLRSPRTFPEEARESCETSHQRINKRASSAVTKKFG